MNTITAQEQQQPQLWRTDKAFGPASTIHGLGLTKWEDRSRITVTSGEYGGYSSRNPKVDISPGQAKLLLADATAFDEWMQSTLPGIPDPLLAKRVIREELEWLTSASI